MTPTEVRLKLLAQGYCPIPVVGKRPYMEGWQDKLKTNPTEIRLWEREFPDCNNTGVLTLTTPLFDVDLLLKECGDAIEAMVREFFEERGEMLTRVGRAPKRGLVFRTDEPFKKQLVKFVTPDGKEQRLEFLGDGQQFVAYGEHPDTREPYRWFARELLDVKRDELPYIRESEARELMDRAVAIALEYGYRIKSEEEGDGERKVTRPKRAPSEPQTFFQRVNARALDTIEPWVKALLPQARHQKGTGGWRVTSKALGRAYEEDLSIHPDGIWDYGPERPYTPIDLVCEYRSLEVLPAALWLCEQMGLEPSALGYTKPRIQEPPDSGDPGPQTHNQQAKETDDEDEGHWHGEASLDDSRTWAIHDLVPEVGKGLIAGQWGTYKTFTALEMAHALMSGVSFLGFEVVRQGGVAFFALEGESEIPIRLQALIDQRGVIKGKAPFVWYDNAPTLLARGAAKALVKRINKAAAKMKANFGVPLVAVFIDTIIVGAGYTKDGGDNDTATTNRVLGTMAEVARQTGCFVFGIDHFGKDVNVGTRGNSTKEGNADVVLALLGDKAITGEVSNCRLALRKRRSGPNGQEFPFRPRLVDMGCDQDGRPMTTLVLDWGKTNPTAAAKPGAEDWGKGKGVKLLRRIVMNLLINQGIDLKPAADKPTVRAISVELVRIEFLKEHYADPEGGKAKQQHAKRVAFKRALDAATDKGALIVRDINGQDYAWVTDGAEPR